MFSTGSSQAIQPKAPVPTFSTKLAFHLCHLASKALWLLQPRRLARQVLSAAAPAGAQDGRSTKPVDGM